MADPTTPIIAPHPLAGCLESIVSVIAWRHRSGKRRRFYSTLPPTGDRSTNRRGGEEEVHEPFPTFVKLSALLYGPILFSFTLRENGTNDMTPT